VKILVMATHGPTGPQAWDARSTSLDRHARA
jgi:hypothetical protein